MTVWNVEWEITRRDGTKQAAVRSVESDYLLTAYEKVKNEIEEVRFDAAVTNVKITSISAQ